VCTLFPLHHLLDTLFITYRQPKWSWARAHPWESWRNRYSKHSAWFDDKIAAYQRKKGIKTPAEPAKPVSGAPKLLPKKSQSQPQKSSIKLEVHEQEEIRKTKTAYGKGKKRVRNDESDDEDQDEVDQTVGRRKRAKGKEVAQGERNGGGGVHATVAYKGKERARSPEGYEDEGAPPRHRTASPIEATSRKTEPVTASTDPAEPESDTVRKQVAWNVARAKNIALIAEKQGQQRRETYESDIARAAGADPAKHRAKHDMKTGETKEPNLVEARLQVKQKKAREASTSGSGLDAAAAQVGDNIIYDVAAGATVNHDLPEDAIREQHKADLKEEAYGYGHEPPPSDDYRNDVFEKDDEDGISAGEEGEEVKEKPPASDDEENQAMVDEAHSYVMPPLNTQLYAHASFRDSSASPIVTPKAKQTTQTSLGISDAHKLQHFHEDLPSPFLRPPVSTLLNPGLYPTMSTPRFNPSAAVRQLEESSQTTIMLPSQVSLPSQVIKQLQTSPVLPMASPHGQGNERRQVAQEPTPPTSVAVTDHEVDEHATTDAILQARVEKKETVQVRQRRDAREVNASIKHPEKPSTDQEVVDVVEKERNIKTQAKFATKYDQTEADHFTNYAGSSRTSSRSPTREHQEVSKPRIIPRARHREPPRLNEGPYVNAFTNARGRPRLRKGGSRNGHTQTDEESDVTSEDEQPGPRSPAQTDPNWPPPRGIISRTSLGLASKPGPDDLEAVGHHPFSQPTQMLYFQDEEHHAFSQPTQVPLSLQRPSASRNHHAKHGTEFADFPMRSNSLPSDTDGSDCMEMEGIEEAELASEDHHHPFSQPTQMQRLDKHSAVDAENASVGQDVSEGRPESSSQTSSSREHRARIAATVEELASEDHHEVIAEPNRAGTRDPIEAMSRNPSAGVGERFSITRPELLISMEEADTHPFEQESPQAAHRQSAPSPSPVSNAPQASGARSRLAHEFLMPSLSNLSTDFLSKESTIRSWMQRGCDHMLCLALF
jgi:hypothetical protein